MRVCDSSTCLQSLEHSLVLRLGSVHDFTQEILAMGVSAGEVGETFLLIAGVNSEFPQ